MIQIWKLLNYLTVNFKDFIIKNKLDWQAYFFSRSNKIIVSSDGTRINGKLKYYFYNLKKQDTFLWPANKRPDLNGDYSYTAFSHA